MARAMVNKVWGGRASGRLSRLTRRARSLVMLLSAVALLAGVTTVAGPAPTAAAAMPDDPAPGLYDIPASSQKIPVSWQWQYSDITWTDTNLFGQIHRTCMIPVYAAFDMAVWGRANDDGTYSVIRTSGYRDNHSSWQEDYPAGNRIVDDYLRSNYLVWSDGSPREENGDAVCSYTALAQQAEVIENGDENFWPHTYWTVGPVDTLTGALFNRPPSTTGDTVKEGELLPLRLRVENHDEDEVTNVHVTSATVVATDEDAAGAATITPNNDFYGAGLPSVIAGNGQVFADFDVMPTHVGTVRAQVRVEATKSTGETISQTYTFDITIKAAPLTVTIEQDPATVIYGQDNNGDGQVTDADNEFDIKVTVTNESADEVTSVDSMDTAQPLRFTGKIGEEAAAVALERIDSEGSSFGDLAAGASKTITYQYRASDRVLADATYTVAGVQDGREVTAHAVQEIKVGKDLWLEASFGPAEPGRAYNSGQTVRLSATLKNVTKVVGGDGSVLDEGFDVGVMIVPAVEGNAAGGNVFKAGSGDLTPLTPVPIYVEPGQTVNLGAVLGTLEMTQPSTAKVTYTIQPFKHPEGEDPTKGDETNVAVETGTETQEIPLAAVAVTTDDWLPCPESFSWARYLSCRATKGLSSFGLGFWNIGSVVAYGTGQAAKAAWGIVSTEVWAMGKTLEVLQGDEAARVALVNEILSDAQAIAILTGEAKSNMPTFSQVSAAVSSSIDSLALKIRTYSVKQWFGAGVEFAAANADATAGLAKLAAQKVAVRVAAGAAGRAGIERAALEKAAAEQADTVGTRVADALTAKQDITKGVLKSGDDVTSLPTVWAKFGAGAKDISNMLQIAQQEGVNLLFRARSAKAVSLLEAGEAVYKPGGVSIKTVSGIDIGYLGYKAEWEAKAVLVKPPIPWQPAGAGRTAAIEAYLNAFSDLRGTSAAATDLRGAVKARLEQRMDEWPVQMQKFSDYADHGIDASFHAEKQGLKEGLIKNEKDLRKAEVTAGTFDGGRAFFELKMDDGTGAMKAITGDIDFLAILNPDGTIIKDVAKRTRIYESLRSMLGMQHGESMTYSGSEQLRQTFLDCCKEGANTMLAATYDGRIVATHFDDALAVMPNGINAELLPAGTAEAIDSVATLTGVTSQMVSAARAGASVPLPPLVDFVGNFIAGKVNPLPSDVKGVMEALTGLEAKLRQKNGKPVFDRSGAALGVAADAGTSAGAEPSATPLIYLPNAANPPGPQPLRVPGRAFATTAAGSSYPAASMLRDGEPIDAAAALAAAWADVVAGGYALPDIGSWRPLTAGDLDADGFIAMVPFTYLGTAADAGDTTLDVLTVADLGAADDSPFLQPGDRIVIDPGTSGEEIAIVRSYAPDGTLRLVSPLSTPHLLAARVQFLAAGTVPGLGSDSSSGSGSGSVPAVPPVTVMVPAGGSASSAPAGTVPSAANPVIATVTSPAAGQVSFATGGEPQGQAGYSMLGQSIVVTAPAATAANPLWFVFDVALGASPEGTQADELVVFRDGEPVARCTDPRAAAASPDPCVASVTVRGGIVSVEVRSSRASVWTVGAPAAELAGQRVAGANRYETSALIAARFGPADAVILANGSTAKDGVDALAANVLAGRVGAPILLTDATSVSPQVLSAVKRVLTGASSPTIYVMGGADSVSDAVAAQVRAAAGSVASGTVRIVRVAGADRYATAAAAAGYGNATAGSVRLSADAPAQRTAILASGVVNADALAAGPVSYAWGIPVLLTGPGDLSAQARSVIAAQGITQLVVLGGADRIPQRALDQAQAAGVTSVKRIAGPDRYATAAQLAAFVADTAIGPDGEHYGAGGAASSVFLANGYTGFPDALSVGPLAGKQEAALLTVGPMTLPATTRDYLAAHRATGGTVMALGRSPTVSAGTLAAANTARAV